MATQIKAEKNIEEVVKWKWDATCYCTYKGENWEIFEWASPGIVQPSNADIETEIPNYQAVLDAKHYQLERATAYANVKEQLDQLYHDMTAGKLDATGEWHKAIKAIKDANPKG